MKSFSLRLVIVVEKTNSVKARQSGIELLRILLMLQVIFLHICVYGGYSTVAKQDFSNIHKALFYSIYLSSRCPVYVYILIFGYFSVVSNKSLISIKGKIAKTYLPMIFYSLCIPLVGQLIGLWRINDVVKVRMFFPFTSRIWYFMTLYLLVLVLSPFLNKALTALSKKEYTQLVVILFFMFSVWTVFSQLEQTSHVIRLDKIYELLNGKSLYGFIYMYILGGYLRLHVPCHNKAKFRYLIIFAVLTVINILLSKYVYSYSNISTANNNPFVVLQGLCLVMFFRDLKFRSKAINYITSVNLGVYMIHEQFLVRNKIWNDWFGFLHKKSFYSTWVYLLKIILICITVYMVCGLIEKVRTWLFAGIKALFWKISSHRKANA